MARPRGKSPNPIVLDRERQVVALRRQGFTWQDIADQVGYSSPSGASEAYYRASYRVVTEDVQAIRELENDRLDLLFSSVWEQALAGDHKATDTCLRIMSRRAKLLGLDTPVSQRVEVTPTYDTSTIQAELQRIIKATERAAELGLDLLAEANYAENKDTLKAQIKELNNGNWAP
jgi:AraC-like DNA-binding protein